MPQPTSDTAVSRPELGQVVNEFRETAVTGRIGLQVMPFIAVPRQSAEYPVLPREIMLKIHDTKRAMRARYPSSDWEFENGFYATKENGWEEYIDDRERKLYATLFDAEVIATRRAVKIIDLAEEQRIARRIFNPDTFAPHPVAAPWDDPANATPISDINASKLIVRAACGMLPNTLIIAYSTFAKLKECEEIIDRLVYTFPGIDLNRMSSAQLAAIFDIENVLVGGAVYDRADKGQDAEIADLWDSQFAMLTITSSSEDISEPCIGRTFRWTEEAPSDEPIVETYRSEGNRSDVVRVRHDTDERLLRSYDEDGNIKSDIAVAVSHLLSDISTE